ncbi:helix-turn-helix domain-containing protein [Bradyrhizobium sp. SEMIA]|uniref:helix-turn-helix domain-containing protein n=1 Tax=Bradyrhizobium sp. SEMIA TaxID=2597515 RepID=UPI002ACECB56|nr:helix-turn-helix domain-containing protein [Bradyrhizobium sp. SEMIA]
MPQRRPDTVPGLAERHRPVRQRRCQQQPARVPEPHRRGRHPCPYRPVRRARATTPRALNTDDRRALLRELRDAGCMQVRRSSDIIAAHLGVSRATVYADAR